MIRMKVSKKEREIVDQLSHLVKGLNDDNSAGALVVVEGQRDAIALAAIGFKGSPYLLCHNGSLAKLSAEAEKYQKIILLLDFDHKGRVLTKKTTSILQDKGNRIDLFYRRRIRMASKGRIQEIEELEKYGEFLASL